MTKSKKAMHFLALTVSHFSKNCICFACIGECERQGELATHAGMEVRGQLAGVASLFPPGGSSGLNAGRQA